MSFFISDAFAQAAPQAQQSPLGTWPFLILMIVVFWFLLVRPQQKRMKDHKKLVDALSKGDEVVTQGGVYGRITDTGENHVELEIADGVKVKVQRQSIGGVLPKGTIKSL